MYMTNTFVTMNIHVHFMFVIAVLLLLGTHVHANITSCSLFYMLFDVNGSVYMYSYFKPEN